jgi:hypothetical protein
VVDAVDVLVGRGGQVDGTPCVAAAVGDVGAPERHVGGHRAVAGDVGELGSPPGPGSATGRARR